MLRSSVKEMLLLSSPPVRQAESRIGSSTMAARRDSFAKVKTRILRAETRRSRRKLEFTSLAKKAPARRHWGSNGERAGPVPGRRGGAIGSDGVPRERNQ